MKTKKSSAVPNPSYDEIAERARTLWQTNGSPHGRDEEFWLSAERELRTPTRLPSSVPSTNSSLSGRTGEGDRLKAKTDQLLGETGSGPRSPTSLNFTH